MTNGLFKPKRHWKEIELWKDVTDEKWNDWIWQLTHTVRTLDDLKKVVNLTKEEEEGVRISTKTIPLNITPYYASLMNPDDPRCPIRMQSVPISEEMHKTKYDLEDPLDEDEDSPVPGLTHRYPDRVLFLVTNQCSMYCRYCTRRRFSGQIGMGVPKKQLDQAIGYIRDTPDVRDVLISGGDGLLINDQILEYILKNLRAIPHVEIIRIGTRAPVVFPQRITDKLCEILKKYHPVWLNTHFNTSIEITEEAKEACEKLVNAGVPVGNQAVILAGINDSVSIMKKLMHDLVKIRVRPYYIYQCDLSEGIGHFRAPVSKGLEIIEGLRGHTSGYAVPAFVVDAPGGGGKIAIQPNYLISQSPDKVVLRNFEGVITSYPEPENYVPGRADEYFSEIYPEVLKEKERTGISAIFEDRALSYTPEGLNRLKRRESYRERPDYETLKSRRAKRDELKEKKFLAQQKKEGEAEGHAT
ncbi:lysine 2,3-aminomutase [Bacillus sonorensis]|uniref:lysine 2,3-aminomutase n=1 Tax=Bacillus TaxID=1386 RepID=UPI000497E8B0|nr:lysine 2,3-aminomutase [Bacillus sonorensis]MBG9915384.1 lysine 2,3-aminomutase [Bacillus sonorensis]MCY7856893.1 lysine 2,3-aminomutase [Bacillus sonorensis]MCY8024452.1 lysine 2,3-aminomutase [Bacillus sonorensis]MCY8035953.1 lysine 2,3-aminomutase [Bacillus sonorensis]MCY8273327.1 lysine 2,3-aminomutase [Bacillus sonorensis]